ncbi:MAG: hypothetical protein CMD96_06125 [Gammaproteobacteria bacterium]|nr:hypothetical protein [Gammaproteobacteria bacterium]
MANFNATKFELSAELDKVQRFMKNKPKIIFLTTLLLSLLTAQVSFAQDQELQSGIERIVSRIDSLFPSVEGYVVSVEGDELLLDLKQGEPIKPGDKLNLIRYGDEVIHPVTKEKLGHKERALGEVEVIRVDKNYSRARVVNHNVKAKEGDAIRSPFKNLSFLIAPIKDKTNKKIDHSRLVLNLKKKLKARPGFYVPGFNLEVWLLESGLDIKKLTQLKNLNRLKKKVKADYILIPSTRSVKGKIVLSYQLVSAKDGSIKNQAQVLFKQMPLLPRTAKSLREQKLQTDFAPRKRKVEFAARQEFPFEIVDFDIGDVNGDGIKEYVIIDHYRVMFFKFEDNRFKRITQVKTKKDLNRFISVDVGDINGNGRDEIFVTNKSGDRLSSFVLERNPKQKQFKKIWDHVNLYFRIIHPFDTRPKLLAQRPGLRNPFEKGIKTIQYRNNRYIEGKEFKVPSIHGMQFILYGLNKTKFNTKKKNLILLDKDYFLRVYSPNGRLLVKSDEYYGHDPRVIDTGVKEELGGVIREGEPVNFKGRLQLVKNGHNNFLLLPKNYRLGGKLLSNMVIVNSSSLVILEITEEGFEKIVETKKQKGFMAAYQVRDYPKTNEKKIHAATVQEGGLTGKTRSTMFTYNWYR